MGLINLWGMTPENNQKALGFAKKIGFGYSGSLPCFFQTPEGPQKAIITNLDLEKVPYENF